MAAEEGIFMKHIPRFQSEAEEAAFWAQHDLTEFEEELEPGTVAAVRGQVVSVRLPPRDVVQLKRLARGKGLGYSTLVRMWIRERLAAENPVVRPRAARRRIARRKQP